MQGVIDFVARQDVSDLDALPQGELLWGMGRSAVLASDGTGRCNSPKRLWVRQTRKAVVDVGLWVRRTRKAMWLLGTSVGATDP